MITLTNADKILRSVYLDAICEEIRTNTSPFLSRIENTSEYLQGKEMIVPCRTGINGGIACMSETANLPEAGNPSYLLFKASLCNIYGNLELTDKVLRVAQGNPASAINVLNSEMDIMLKSAKFQLSRMLFQNGKGILCRFDTHAVANPNMLSVDSTKNLAEGMIVDILNATGVKMSGGYTITAINRSAGTVSIYPSTSDYTGDYMLTIQGSYNNEIYGIPYLFDSSLTTLYGNVRAAIPNILPRTYSFGDVTNDNIQEILDNTEEFGGSQPNLLIASYAARRAYLEYLRTNCLNVNHQQIEAGFSSITFNGIPLYVEKFAPDDSVFFVNTNDFKMIQLNDWSWVEGNTNNILNPISGKAAYYATLVKYCNIMCIRPMAQAKLYLDPSLQQSSSGSGSTTGSGSTSGSGTTSGGTGTTTGSGTTGGTNTGDSSQGTTDLPETPAPGGGN